MHILTYSCFPGLEFHASGAFIGKLTGDLPQRVSGEADDRSLTHAVFLATPLLPFGKPGFEEEKWSGTNQTGDNNTATSRIISAFAHHSVIDSQMTCLLVDLQGLIHPDGSITLIDPQAHTYAAFIQSCSHANCTLSQDLAWRRGPF